MTAKVVVIGLGYVGLPLAREAVRAGLQVVGFDTDRHVVAAINDATSHVDDISADDLMGMLARGFRATADEADLEGFDTAVICVPTPLTGDGGPDLGAVRASSEAVARHVSPGALVVLESTTYPGTTEDVVRPILERGGLCAGVDFALAYSPERVDPGNPTYGIANTPKVVGGLTPACTDRAATFYGRFVEQIARVRGAREAEMAKLLENTYRHINIALVNEMARFCHELDIDLWDVIAAASTKPFGFQAFYPGPGVGGHCIPIDPNYLSHSVRSRLGYPFRFVELAQEINATMPNYVARRVQDVLNDDGVALHGASVLLLGITYKADVSDQRESPATPLARALARRGAEVSFHDPSVVTWNVGDTELTRVHDLVAASSEADIVVLLQNHASYDLDALVSSSQRFFDAKGATRHPAAHRL